NCSCEPRSLPDRAARLARPRPRARDQEPVWAVHALSADGPVSEVQYETDRARFLGRGRTPAAPAALDPGAVLSGTTGPVLDPVLAIRKRVRLEPEAAVTLAFTTGLADNREEALALADHYRDPHPVLRAFELAWAHSQVELRHLQLPGGEAQLYQRLASHLVYAGPALRGDPEALAGNRLGRTALWRFALSGAVPALLVVVGDPEPLPLVRQILAAHSFWRLKGLEVDLVILNEMPTAYQDELDAELRHLIRISDSHGLADKRG